MLSDFDPANDALKFVDKRIANPRYRGLHSSQHNRYTLEKTRQILELLHKHSQGGLMAIRTTDISKRPKNTADERAFAEFCHAAKSVSGIGTQDAMRKNLFVDFHRMGLIERYNKNKVCIAPYQRSSIKYVALSARGLRFIQARKLLDQYFIFSKAIDQLLGGSINYLLDLLRDSDYELSKVTLNEYMLFVSAIHSEVSYSITVEQCATYINDFRKLGRIKTPLYMEHLKEQLKPENYSGDKTTKRDYHNWRNEAQQVFSLLAQTVYFEIRGEDLMLRTGKDGFASEDEIRLSRSLSEKHLYFKKHGVQKQKGFELHHVIPLAYAESKEQFKLLDTWQNMVYIDAFSHAKITQNNNKNIFMKVHVYDIELDEHEHKTTPHSVYLSYKSNIAYGLNRQSEMLERNQLLVNDLP